MAEWEDGEELSPEEAQLLRFQFENSIPLKAAHLGFDIDRLVHEVPAGRHLIETAIDQVHNSMIELLDADLASPEARDLQVRGRAAKLMIDIVINTLESGRNAALQVADEQLAEEGNEQ